MSLARGQVNAVSQVKTDVHSMSQSHTFRTRVKVVPVGSSTILVVFSCVGPSVLENTPSAAPFSNSRRRLDTMGMWHLGSRGVCFAVCAGLKSLFLISQRSVCLSLTLSNDTTFFEKMEIGVDSAAKAYLKFKILKFLLWGQGFKDSRIRSSWRESNERECVDLLTISMFYTNKMTYVSFPIKHPRYRIFTGTAPKCFDIQSGAIPWTS